MNRIALFLFLFWLTPVKAELVPDSIGDLQTFARAYAAADARQMAPLLVDDIEHADGVGSTTFLWVYQEMLWRADQPWIRFRDVRIDGNRLAAWFDAQGTAACTGIIEIEYRGERWSKLTHLCLNVGPDIDGATAGQAADAATTALALGSSLAEANPIAAGIIDTGGVPLLAATKIGLGEAVESLPNEECRAWKDSLAVTGWGAAGWNLGLVAAGPHLGIPLALAGAVGAWNWMRPGNAAACLEGYGPVDVRLVSAEVIVPKNPNGKFLSKEPAGPMNEPGPRRNPAYPSIR